MKRRKMYKQAAQIVYFWMYIYILIECILTCSIDDDDEEQQIC